MSQQIKATSANYSNSVQALYIAYFGRPADPGGLANFEATLLAAGAPADIQGLNKAYASSPAIQSLVNSFGNSKESANLYGSGTTTSFVTAIFQNVLSRAPQAAGLSFWVNAIDSGQVTKGDAALSIVAGALANTTAQGLLDAQLINSRLTTASYFTSEVSALGAVSAYSGSNAAASARSLLAAVTQSTNTTSYQPTVVAAVNTLLQQLTLTGTVFAASTNGASLSVYLANAQGQPTGNPIGTGSTTANGVYSIFLSSVPTGPVVIVSNGGSFISEADGSSQTAPAFSVLVPSLKAGNNVAQVNPLTSAISSNAVNILSNSNGVSAQDALTNSTASVEVLFGLTTLTTNPQTLAPDPNATSGDAWVLSGLAGTIEQLRASTGLPTADLYKALMDDISDGKLDGLKNGQPISIGTSGIKLQASLFTSQLSGAANAYGANHPAYQAATSQISGALQLSAQAVGVAIGSSGSISPLQTQGKGTQIYFAARTDGLVKLDMSNPANPSASKVTAINQAVLVGGSSGPIFSSVDGIVINPTPNAADGKIYGILYSYGSQTIVSVNLTDGVVAGTAVLPASTSVSFSGASANVAGGIADGQRGLIWLATGSGLMGVNPFNLSAPAISIAQPPGTQINENIGGDPGHGIVFSPDYNSQGIVVFNLAEAKAYLMNQSDWAALTASSGFGSSGSELDGAALDSQYRVAVITPEDSGTIGLMGYTTPSGASSSVGNFSSSVFTTYASTGYFSGSAIDPVSHTALFVGEGSNLGVGVIDNPANPNWQGFKSFVSTGNSIYEFEPHDPHTVGIFNIGGKPYGFVLNGYGPYQIVILDLNAMLAASATSGTLNADPLTDPTIATLLSY